MVTTTIIGDGRVGRALVLAAAGTQFEVVSLVSRRTDAGEIGGIVPETLEHALTRRSELLIIATQDSEIAAVAAEVAGLICSSKVVLHTSGAISSEILAGLRENGCAVGSIHPLVSISDPEIGATLFADANFCVEGDPSAVVMANSLVAALGGRSFTVATDKKSLYHAAAVLTSGGVVSLLDVAAGLLARCGLSPSDALDILYPLLKSTVVNLADNSTARALTGPFARGDAETVQQDVVAVTEFGRAIDRELFIALGRVSLEIAARQGEKSGHREIAAMLDNAAAAVVVKSN